jgi:hypothetical protein
MKKQPTAGAPAEYEARPVYEVTARRGGDVVKAERTEAAVEAITTGVSHLRAIFWLLSMLDGERLQEEGAGDLTTMLEEIGTLGAGVCDDLYGHARFIVDDNMRKEY